jgi:hypothetical protein
MQQKAKHKEARKIGKGLKSVQSSFEPQQLPLLREEIFLPSQPLSEEHKEVQRRRKEAATGNRCRKRRGLMNG